MNGVWYTALQEIFVVFNRIFALFMELSLGTSERDNGVFELPDLFDL